MAMRALPGDIEILARQRIYCVAFRLTLAFESAEVRWFARSSIRAIQFNSVSCVSHFIATCVCVGGRGGW